jgi:hypothetical protein
MMIDLWQKEGGCLPQEISLLLCIEFDNLTIANDTNDK